MSHEYSGVCRDINRIYPMIQYNVFWTKLWIVVLVQINEMNELFILISDPCDLMEYFQIYQLIIETSKSAIRTKNYFSNVNNVKKNSVALKVYTGRS